MYCLHVGYPMYCIQSYNPASEYILTLPQRYVNIETAKADLATLQILFPHLEYIVCTV
jgi:hypothetical protein